MLSKPLSWLKLASILALATMLVVFVFKTPKRSLTTPIVGEAILPTMAPTITVSPTATPTASLTPSPTASPSATPTATVIPENPFSSEEIQGFFKEYSNEYGVDIHYLRHVAVCESGFNPLASYHIYAGLFQFDGATWKSFRKIMNEDPDPDLRFNAREAVKTAAYLFSIGKAHLWPNCLP